MPCSQEGSEKTKCPALRKFPRLQNPCILSSFRITKQAEKQEWLRC